MGLKPQLEMSQTLNDGTEDRWGLKQDDACIAIMRYTDGAWVLFTGSHVPDFVAQHMGTLAAESIAWHAAFEAAHHVMYHDNEPEAVGGPAAAPSGETLQ